MYEPCTCAACMAIIAETPDNTAINGEVQRIIEQLWNSKKAISFDSGLLVEQSRLLLGAMNNGYGKTLTDVAWNSTDFEMLANLTKNVYQFSAAKNYQELKDFTTAIVDGDRIRSFSEYQTACNDINAKYNGSWLLSEYNQAIASSQMAGKWADFEANKKDMPMLKYQTIGDSNVRDSHARLDGIVKSIDDSFWNSYYPPNGWGCRCEVIQLTSKTAKATDTSNKELPAVPTMWQINVGKQGIVYPVSHPYYIGIPEGILDKETQSAVNKHFSNLANDWIKNNVDEGIIIKESKTFYSGKAIISRSTLREVANHSVGSNKLFAIKLGDIFKDMKPFKEKVALKEGIKYENGLTHFNYYKFTANKKEYLLNMKCYENGTEKPYAIRSKKQKS